MVFGGAGAEVRYLERSCRKKMWQRGQRLYRGHMGEGCGCGRTKHNDDSHTLDMDFEEGNSELLTKSGLASVCGSFVPQGKKRKGWRLEQRKLRRNLLSRGRPPLLQFGHHGVKPCLSFCECVLPEHANAGKGRGRGSVSSGRGFPTVQHTNSKPEGLLKSKLSANGKGACSAAKNGTKHMEKNLASSCFNQRQVRERGPPGPVRDSQSTDASVIHI